MLEWLVETQGYSVTEIDTVSASDDELVQRLDEYLEQHPLTPTRVVLTEVEGSRERLRTLLDGDRYDSAPGKRGAQLWFNVADRGGTSDATVATQQANPHEEWD